MHSIAVVLSTLLAVTVSAATSNYTLPAGFNINAVPESERSSWCLAQRNSCPQICGGTTNSNACDASTLTFNCVCSNDSTADVAPYTQTVPFFVCQATYAQCIKAATTLDDDEKCKAAQEKCGSLNATEASGSSSSTTSTSLPTATGSANGKQAESSTTPTATTSSSASAQASNAAIRLGQEHSTGLIATVLFFAARLLL